MPLNINPADVKWDTAPISKTKIDPAKVQWDDVSIPPSPSLPSPSEPPKWATGQGVLGSYGPTAYGIGGAGYEAAKPLIKTGAETIGMGIGETIGAIGAPFTMGASIPIGGGYGYAAVKSAERGLGLEETSPESSFMKDIKTGAAISTSGAIIGKGIGYAAEKLTPPLKRIGTAIGEKIGLTKPVAKSVLTPEERKISEISGGAIQSAAAKLKEAIKTPEEIALATKEAEKISKATGVPFRRGQIINDEGVLALERNLMINEETPMSKLEQLRRNEADKALKDYYQNKVLKGEAGIPQVNKAVQDIQRNIKANVTKYEQIVNVSKNALATGIEPQIGGKTLYQEAQAAAVESQRNVNKLYEQVPNVSLKSDKIQNAIDFLKSEAGEGRDASVYPWNILNEMERKIKPKAIEKTESLIVVPGMWDEPAAISKEGQDISLHTLKNYEQQVNEMIGEAKRGNIPDRVLGRNLAILKDAINKTMDNAEGDMSQNAVNLYRQAKEEAAKHAEKFYQGTIADILQKGSRNELTNIPMSEMAAQFFTKGKGAPEAADDFFRAIGDSKAAKNVIRDYASYKFLKDMGNEPITIGKLNNWKLQYRDSLQKFGLENEFNNVTNATKLFEKAKEMEVLFDKHAISQVLGKDTNKAMEAIYTGKNLKESAKVTQEILDTLKNNEPAIEGFKNAFAEHLRNLAEGKKESLMGENTIFLNSVKKINEQYGEAITTLYKNEPKRLVALRNFQKALEVSSRTAKPLLTGSDTATKLSALHNAISSVSGYVPGGKIAKVLAGFIKPFKEASQVEVNNIITEATFNPKLAETIIKAAKGQIKPKIFSDEIARHIGRLVAIEGYNKTSNLLYPQSLPIETPISQTPDAFENLPSEYKDNQ